MVFRFKYIALYRVLTLAIGLLFFFTAVGGDALNENSNHEKQVTSNSGDQENAKKEVVIYMLNAPVAPILTQVDQPAKFNFDFSDIALSHIKIFSHFISYIISYFHTLFVFIICCMAP